jgi:hypothetical protein
MLQSHVVQKFMVTEMVHEVKLACSYEMNIELQLRMHTNMIRKWEGAGILPLPCAHCFSLFLAQGR